MELLHIVVLALIQGLTEFLPVSSSAHLILPSQVLGWQDQGLAFDVAVHVGTLSAVVLYFRRDLAAMSRAWFGQFAGRPATADTRLGWAVILGTIPAGLAGLLLNDFVEAEFRSIAVIATTTILFGLLLGWADRFKGHQRELSQMTWKDVLVIGLSQAIALIPGTSRSGITMTMALFMGLSRDASARFSFLLSIPLILAAGGLKTLELVEQGAEAVWSPLILGALIAGGSAYLCIHFFLKFLQKISFMPFVIYRIVLGLGLFALVGLG